MATVQNAQVGTKGGQTLTIQPPKIVTKSAEATKILGMMALVGVLGVVGAEVRNTKTKTKPADKIGIALSSPFLVLAGVTLSSVILVSLASFAGEPGETLGVGLAGVALVGALLIEGQPIAGAVTGLFKKTATSPKASKGAGKK